MAHWSRPSKSTLYAEPSICLGCDQEFQSWDRRENRVCPRCRNELAEEPSDGAGVAPFQAPTFAY
jgi:predicted amidophosphoribosyltransferase